jgi:hypothetical protein
VFSRPRFEPHNVMTLRRHAMGTGTGLVLFVAPFLQRFLSRLGSVNRLA